MLEFFANAIRHVIVKFFIFRYSNVLFINISKIHIFWEGHKILRNFHLTFVLCSVSQSKVKISQNFVVFSEYMNFTKSLYCLKENLDEDITFATI